MRSPMLRSGLADRDIADSIRCLLTVVRAGNVSEAHRSGLGRTVRAMRETSGRSAGMRRGLAIGVIVLAFITRLLDAVNAVIAPVTSVG
jgi:hypothetical protein